MCLRDGRTGGRWWGKADAGFAANRTIKADQEEEYGSVFCGCRERGNSEMGNI